MRYMMFVCIDPDTTLRPEDDTIEEWVAEVESRKLRQDGDRLRPPSAATTVRRRDGEGELLGHRSSAVVDRDRNTFALHVQHEVFAHDRQANQTDVAGTHEGISIYQIMI